MFCPSSVCRVSRRAIGSNIYGEYDYGDYETVRCSVLDHNVERAQTTVRADSGGSRGYGFENSGDLILGFMPNDPIRNSDRIELYNQEYRVINVFPIANSFGKVTYLEVLCAIWQSN